MALSLLNHPKVSGSGRLTEICTYRRTDVVSQSQQKGTSPQQLLSGPMSTDNKTTILLSDFPQSSSSTDLPHYGPPAKNLLTVDHILLPGSPTSTEAPWYIISHMTIPQFKQPQFIALFEPYLKGIFNTLRPVFHHSGTSLENPNVLVSIWGWNSEADAKEYMDYPAHLEFGTVAGNFVTAAVSYQGKLEKASGLRTLSETSKL